MADIVTFAGMPGSGKSSAARELAALLSSSGTPCLMVDLDEEITRRAGKIIAQIFAEDGEPSFRAMEKAILKEIISKHKPNQEQLIIALGGGTLDDPDNLALVRDHTYCIWLDIPIPELASRLLAHGLDSRPLLNKGNGPDYNELQDRLQELYDQRKAAFVAASKEIR